MDDLLELYLSEISRRPLLAPDEELALARQARRGDLEARCRLIEANLRWVVKIARGYQGRNLCLLDLIQEGNLGLMRAVDLFDPDSGIRLSTYASFWIRQAVLRALSEHSRSIRIPVHLSNELMRMQWARRKLEQQLGRPPTLEEIADQLGLAVAKMAQLERLADDPVSLDAPFMDDDESSLVDCLPADPLHEPGRVLLQRSLREQLRVVLSRLSEREQCVLRLRFGLDDDLPHTLEQVGARLGVSRERVRQIEQAALDRLRRLTESRGLREFLPL